MTKAPLILLTDPAHFGVSYVINPWMRPEAWAQNPALFRVRARAGFAALTKALTEAGARLDVMPGRHGLPDLVFPANAAIVLDRKALMARFCHAERRGEEPVFHDYFIDLQARGLLDEVATLPEGCFQEGAGDCIWDAARDRFWAGWGPRSVRESLAEIAACFGHEVTALELMTPNFYHLDTCFCPLSGGEILYFPPAFAADSLRAIREVVPGDSLIAATPEEASLFSVNAVNWGNTIVMARTTPRLRAILAERRYRVVEIDLAPYLMAGGGAFCMTLRLDRKSAAAAALKPAA